MSTTILLGMPRIILSGGAIAVLVAATAITLKITQPKVTLPRAAVAAPVVPVHPAPESTPWQFKQTLARFAGRDGVTLSGRDACAPLPAALVAPLKCYARHRP